MVAAQYFSPEQNLYNQKNYQSRFDVLSHFQIYLPVMGNWTITQAHDGEHTHKEDWKHAFDFEITDEQGLKYETNGFEAKDYFCFGQVVLAPADGVVQEIQEGIPDNNKYIFFTRLCVADVHQQRFRPAQAKAPDKMEDSHFCPVIQR